MYNIRFENFVMFNKRPHKSCSLQAKKLTVRKLKYSEKI